MPPKIFPHSPWHSKRVTIEVSGGWSIVSRSQARPAKVPKATQADESVIHHSAPDPDRIAVLVSEINEYVKRWRSTRCATELKEILDRRKSGAGHLESAMCAGLGSLCTEDDWHKRTRMWQLAAFLWLSGLISSGRRQRGTPLKLYAQEPRFTPTDTAVLENFGIQTLPDLNAREYISARTLLYAPFLPWLSLLKDILRDCRPEICISIDLRGFVEHHEIQLKHNVVGIQIEGEVVQQDELESCVQVANKFLENMNDFAFPEFELHSETLHGLRVYLDRDER